ncbi:Protein of unknown function DUF1416 [Fimbriimonadaceae bacterium]
MNRWNGMRKAGSAWSVCVCSALLITVIACGGGGGGGGSTSASGGGSGGTFTEVAVEFRTPDNYAVDPSNIRVGDTLQMYLWGRDSTGQIGAVPSSNWSTTAPGSIAVTSSSGAFEAKAATSTTYVVRANGNEYTANFTIKAASGGLVAGRVRNTDSQGVPGAFVRIYNAAGAQVGTAVTGSNGTFRVVAPFNATGFLVDMTGLATRYYNQFGYGASEYSVICPDSKATLPAVSSSSLTLLPSNPVVYRKVGGTTPPPPPPDCGL